MRERERKGEKGRERERKGEKVKETRIRKSRSVSENVSACATLETK